jgi:K+-transporting ATPase ATPase A chain
MHIQFLGLLASFLAVLFLLAWPLGNWLSKIAQGQLPRWTKAVERPLFKCAGIRADGESNWRQYTLALLLFNALGIVAVFTLQRFQAFLPLNPQAFPAVEVGSALNTAISFVTNTNWQGYAGEATMSYLTQMLALTVQNFFSAATGIAVVFALIRGLARKSSADINNSKSGSYPVAGRPSGGLNGPSTGAILSLT